MKEFIISNMKELIRLDKVRERNHTLFSNSDGSCFIDIIEDDARHSMVEKWFDISNSEFSHEDILADIIRCTQPYTLKDVKSNVKTIDEFIEKWGEYIVVVDEATRVEIRKDAEEGPFIVNITNPYTGEIINIAEELSDLDIDIIKSEFGFLEKALLNI